MQTENLQTEKKHVNYAKKIGRISLKIFLYLILFIVLVFVLVLTPPVQHFLTGKVQHYLQNKLKTRVEIGSISFGLSGRINLENVYIEDKTRDTLVAGGAIKAHVNLLKLFSNEVQVKDIEFQNITAKIKRVLPDTVFNYQFITNAFTSEQAKKPDTSASAPLKLDISDITFDNINLRFNDVISGSDLNAHIGNLSATIDSLDIYKPNVVMPTLIVRNMQVSMNQRKPLLTPKPLAQDISQAAAPSNFGFSFGTIDLNKVSVNYNNDVSAIYSSFIIGRFKADGKKIDMLHQQIYLEQIALADTKMKIRLGKKAAAETTVKEAGQKVQAQASQPWDFRLARLRLDNNSVQFDNDNSTPVAYGLDNNHIKGDSVTLYADNLILKPDSISLRLTKGTLIEKSGLHIQGLQGDILYASHQAYLKNFYIKTPGTEIRKDIALQYPSPDAFTKDPSAVSFNIDLNNSHIQVKDILVFAPQLRTQPAFSNRNAIWTVNLAGNGTMNRLNIEKLQFDGLGNTQINAKGTLAGLMHPTQASGNFTIYRFHTTQSDIASLTGQRLSNASVNMPEVFDISGTISGGMANLATNLSINTSEGFIGLNGRFSNLSNPSAAAYTANIQANNLQLGNILKMQGQVGNLTGHFAFSGSGISPQTINARFKGTISSVAYNHYPYHNIMIAGYMKKKDFEATAIVHDPNIDLNLTAGGDLSNNPSFRINGMVDSIKLLPLHFTSQPVVFRGKINGTVANLNNDVMDANVLITQTLLVSGTSRLNMDTVQLIAGRSDSGNYVRLKSDIIKANMTGQFRMADMASIIQHNIQPYFAVATSAKTTTPQVKPYDIRFNADMVYHPVMTSFVPSLTGMQPLHMEGSLASGQGMNLSATSSYLAYAGNEINNMDVRVHTADSGLTVNGVIGHLKSGTSFDLYHARINATALNNQINFNLGIDDKAGKNKYYLAGLFTQPGNGSYAVHLNPNPLLLNYQNWTVAPNNLITITPTNINATDFIISQGAQSLSIISSPGAGSQPLNVNFRNFHLATITGFIKADTLLADGLINGGLVFRDIMKQPLFTGDLTIADLSMHQDTIGNVHLTASNTSPTSYRANLTLTGRGNDVELAGTAAQLSGGDVALDLDLAVRRLALQNLQGVLMPAVTNTSGNITGNVKINGTTAKPNIDGRLNFQDAHLTLATLGSPFSLANESIVLVNNQGFNFNHFTIRDSANRTLDINGQVATTNFVNYQFNLDINSQNFEALNSKKTQGSLYYGKLFLTTRLHISGTEIKPRVDGSVVVGDSTNLTIVIPTAEPGVVDRDGIVQFIDKSAGINDSLFKAPLDSIKKTANVLGLDVAVNIVLRKEANFNIVVDQVNGDFLNVKGEGQLTAGIDPSGKTSLTGTYTLDQGGYQLTFNFLQRKFTIEKGSSITWLGDPTTAQLNITAVYVANTAPLDLIQDQLPESSTNRNTYLQKLPFQVHLVLTGELMQPNVAFDIMLPADQNYGVSKNIVTDVTSRLEQLRQDPGEMNKQVFALLLLNRFVGSDPFQSAGGGGGLSSMARASVSKLLTEQLNSLASGLINGVDINFDVASTDDYTTGSLRSRTDLNVGLSKRLLNNRLTVTVGSNFELEGPQQSNQQSNNIAGNLSVNYQISKDGRYMLRLYRRNNYDQDLEGYVIETGVGFIISMDYNKFADIMRKRKARNSITDKAAPKPLNQ